MIASILLILSFALLSLGQLGRISFLNQEINFYLYEPVVALGLLYFFWKFGADPLKAGYKKYKIVYFFLLSLLFSFLLSSFSFSPQQNAIAFLYLVRIGVYLGFWGYLGSKEQEYRRPLALGMWIFIGLTIIFSFVQYFFYPDLQNLVYLGWDPHFHRMFGVFFDTSVAAAVLGLLMLYALGKLGNFRELGVLGILGLFVGLALVALVLTFARSAYIALFISAIYYFAARKKLYFVVLFAVLFMVLLAVVPKQFGQGVGLTRTFSITSRFADYQQGIRIWLKHPLFGIGYNRIRFSKERLNLVDETGIPSHSAASLSSSYLMVLVCGGIVGLILFLISLFKLMTLNREAAAIVLFIGVMSLFDNIILHPFVLFLLGGVLVSAERKINLFDK